LTLRYIYDNHLYMTATANLLNTYTLDQYATLAFSLDAKSPTGFGTGGVYAGPITKAPEAKPWYSQFACPGNSNMHARARLVSIPVGKIFVRWAKSETRGDWKAASGGIWWVSDNMADYIVRKTSALAGGAGDTSPIARQYAQVDNNWSDMGTVIVCQTTFPIKVLVGVGRPVIGVPSVASDIPDGIQVIILTAITSPKDPSRRRFIADQFFEKLWLGSSRDFTYWWLHQNFISKRRVAQRVANTGK
jgi:hypothetical protein